MVVIEMNPRVSRSSALASKATGFPIAKIAARLAVGYRLDEIANDITRQTPACFEPTIDYVVTKIPRFTFEKFPAAVDELGPQMKSVGEVMAIGRTFAESLHKAMRSLETGSSGFESRVAGTQPRIGDGGNPGAAGNRQQPADLLSGRWTAAGNGYPRDCRNDRNRSVVHRRDRQDRARRGALAQHPLDATTCAKSRPWALPTSRIAELTGTAEEEIARRRSEAEIKPVFKTVDTCAAEFQAFTPYLYSSYDGEDEADPTDSQEGR